MDRSTPLLLTEEVLLLALRDRRGTLHGVHWSQAVAGATLAELLLAGRIRIEGKKQLIEVASREPLNDPVIDDCLAEIAGAKRRASIKTWMGRFANRGELKHRIARRLCTRGVLRQDEDKVLLFFSRKIYPEADPLPEREIKARLRRAIFESTRDVDARTIVLVSLCDKTGILPTIFDKKKLKERKSRIEALVNGDEVGAAAKKVIEEMEAALFAIGIMPVILMGAS